MWGKTDDTMTAQWQPVAQHKEWEGGLENLLKIRFVCM